VIVLENVLEWTTWGPLGPNKRPDPSKLGRYFRAFLGRLSDIGYVVDYQELVAADYGAPTTRRRLCLIARCDRGAIVWPEATHGAGCAAPWQPAASIIDWSIPARSIFGRKKPLVEATLARIARGIQRYVIEANEPFIIPVTHQGDTRVHSICEPMRTITAAHRGEYAYVEPFIVRHGHYSKKTGAGLRLGCGAGVFRGQPLRLPLATVCATNDKHLVVPYVMKTYGGGKKAGPGVAADRPIGTVTARDHHALVTSFLTKYYGTSTGSSLRQPVPTILSGGGKGGHHLAEVRAFLVKYYSAGGRGQAQSMRDPMHTIPTHDRFGLVEVLGQPWQIVDIGMRMLEPHELFAAQGFPDTYQIAPTYKGKPLTRTAQIHCAGNAVPPPMAAALIRANMIDAARAA
jgi:DNA (cytosine-5)-methyltransferase 1